MSLRGKLHALSPQILVGGTTALQHDNNQSSRRDLKVIIPLILLAVTIILVFLLRSLWAPLVLLLTTLLSFGATLGVAAWLFNHVWHFPGADPSVVIFGFVFLVALGIDYNIFLMTRVREEIIKTNLRTGVLKALVVTGGVITSAGIVLATFAALGVIPILFLVQIAFIVAFGVLLDTLLVRSLLVPSLSLELGPKIWWPTKVKKESKMNWLIKLVAGGAVMGLADFLWLGTIAKNCTTTCWGAGNTKAAVVCCAIFLFYLSSGRDCVCG